LTYWQWLQYLRNVGEEENCGEGIDWGRDYEIFHPDFVADPYPVYDQLRRWCPVAHTERHGGSWLLTRHEDIVAIAYDTENFTSREIGVVPIRRPEGYEDLRIPPIDSDPPGHATDRRLILPFLAPKAVERLEPVTRGLCRDLLDGFASSGRVDAAMAYAAQVPVRVISRIIGVDESRSDDFISWARGIFELGPQDP
jgi:hypothetical protein